MREMPKERQAIKGKSCLCLLGDFRPLSLRGVILGGLLVKVVLSSCLAFQGLLKSGEG